jgi:RNA polymerase sigma factor (sigma-70 family)
MDLTPDCKQQQVITYLGQIARSMKHDSSPLRRFLWRYEHTPDNQDDIIQEAMLEALRCSHLYLAAASVHTWFYGVLANVARHHVARQTKQWSRTESLDRRQEASGATEADGGYASGLQTPDELAQFRQTVEQLSGAMHQLPPSLLQTLELVCLEEYSYQDAARRLRIPVGTVRSRINRARMLLRRLNRGAVQRPAKSAR